MFARQLFQIQCVLLVALPSSFLCLPCLTGIMFNPISTHCLRMHPYYQNFPNAASLQMSPNKLQLLSPSAGVHLEVVQTVLQLEIGLMLFLRKPIHSYFLSLVEHPVVGLPQPFRKLLQGRLHWLHDDCGFTHLTAEVRPILTLISCIIHIVGNLWQWCEVCNPYNICFHCSTGGWNCFSGRLIWGLQGSLEGAPGGGVVLENVGPLTGLIPCSYEDTPGVSADDCPCPGNCTGGIISESPKPPWSRSYPWDGTQFVQNHWLSVVVDYKLLGVMLNGEWRYNCGIPGNGCSDNR